MMISVLPSSNKVNVYTYPNHPRRSFPIGRNKFTWFGRDTRSELEEPETLKPFSIYLSVLETVDESNIIKKITNYLNIYTPRKRIYDYSQDTLSELEKLTNKLEQNFDDIRQKQLTYFKIKKEFDFLWESSAGDNRRIALRLESFINNTKSEDLKRNHIKALKTIFKILREHKENSIKEIKQILIENRMWTLPKIKGLTELYMPE